MEEINHQIHLITELNNKIKQLEEEKEDLKIYIESNKQQIEEVETLVMDNAYLKQKLEKIEKYCRVNRVSGWVDIGGILKIIRGEE